MLAAVAAMPVHHANQTTFLVILIGMGVILVAIAGWWWVSREYTRSGIVLPLLMLGIGLASLIQEPVFDNAALYWYPHHNDWSLFTAFGREIPAYIPIGYGWFFGGVSFILYRLFSRYGTSRLVWQLFAISVVIDTVATAAVSWMHAAGFYGYQPFNVFDYPLWFAWVDAGTTILNAVLLMALVPRLKGIRFAWLLVIPLITYSAQNGVVDTPITLALHSGWSHAAIWLMGTLSIVLGSCIVFGCSLLVPILAHRRADAGVVKSTEDGLAERQAVPVPG